MSSERRDRGRRLFPADPLLRRSLGWCAIGLGMLLVIGIMTAWTLRQVKKYDYWVDHTRDVISNAEEVLTDLKDAEAGQRGYIITGDESYLPRYRSAISRVPTTMQTLIRLTADNDAEQHRLRQMLPLIKARLDSMAEAAQQRKESGFDASRQVIINGNGTRLMAEIRVLGEQVEDEEYGLLRQRSEERRVGLRDALLAIAGAFCLALFVFVSAPLDVRRAVEQRDLATRDLEESRSMAHAMFESASQGVFVTDRSGHILMANPAMEKMFGLSADEAKSLSVEQFVPDQFRGKHSGLREGYFGNPQNRPMGVGLDLQARRKDGSEFYAEISLSHIHTTKGTLAVVFVTDISKRREYEQELRQSREQLRLLAGKLITAQDDERRRIARDLHDDFSQRLAHLSIDLGKMASDSLPETAKSHLLLLQQRAAETGESVRRLSHQLHPSILDDIGLEAALEQYCEEFEERTGIETEFVCRNVPEPLPTDIASCVYHIGIESLRNVAKHSKTEVASVILEGLNGMLRLSVRDQGVGMSSETAKLGRTLGFVAMKERANLVNGHIAIDSSAGEGTMVSVEVPLSSMVSGAQV